VPSQQQCQQGRQHAIQQTVCSCLVGWSNETNHGNSSQLARIHMYKFSLAIPCHPERNNRERQFFGSESLLQSTRKRTVSPLLGGELSGRMHQTDSGLVINRCFTSFECSSIFSFGPTGRRPVSFFWQNGLIGLLLAISGHSFFYQGISGSLVFGR